MNDLSAGRRFFSGTMLPLPGDDIDTDRILPARYLKNITFEGLGDHVFEDARSDQPDHPFNQPCFAGASVLVTGRNFGCGSSREHAPRALNDRGIRLIVGTSFAEIFLGNCVSIGVPCLLLDEQEVAWLHAAAADCPGDVLSADIERLSVVFQGRQLPASMPPGARRQILDGSWDVTSTLLQAGDAIERRAGSLPYIRQWPARE